MRIGSLFSGIGGLELGLERARVGRTIWQAESDPFCRSVLARHWPQAHRLEDVRDVSPRTVERVDLICGGFPCQDVSVAGKGAGLDGERSGLWREFARVIDECGPAFVIVENVAHGRGRWLPRVLADLSALGYVPAPLTVSAGDVGAPHARARTFVIADTDGLAVRYLEQWGSPRRAQGVRPAGQGVALDASASRGPPIPPAWITPPDVDRMGDGLSPGLDRARLRALGNAVVPQVAQAVGLVLLASRANLIL